MAKSIVGSFAKPAAVKAAEPVYKRLRSGYSIVDPKTERVLGEIQPYLARKPSDKKGWWMTFGGDKFEAPAVGPLFVLAGCSYRLYKVVRPEPPEVLSKRPKSSLWNMLKAKVIHRLVACVDPELRKSSVA